MKHTRGFTGGSLLHTESSGFGTIPRLAGSCPSSPDISSAAQARSSTQRAKTPSWSSEGDCGNTPVRGSSPNVGL